MINKKFFIGIVISICHYMAIAMDNIPQQILYAANYYQNTISAYSISPSGTLTPFDIGMVRTPISPADVEVIDGTFLYVVGWDDPTIYIYSIQVNGKLIQESFTASVGYGSWGMYINPTNTHMYVSNFYSSNISLLDVNTANNGKVQPMNPSSIRAGTGVCGMAFNSLDSRYLYAVNYYQNNVYMYEIESVSGTLNLINSFTTGVYPRSIRITNSHAYVTNQQSATISMYNIDKISGELIPMQPATMKTGIAPIGSKIEKSGKYFYVASYNENMIYMYEIQKNGLLKPLSPAKVSSGQGPRGFIEDKYGHLYVSNMQDNSISMYQVESNSGILTPLSPAKQLSGSGLAMAIVDLE